MNKKIIIMLLAGVTAVSSFNLCAVTANADSSIGIYIDDEALSTEVNPVIINDRVMVPMRAIFEALGAKVQWTDGRSTYNGKGRISSTFAGNQITMSIDEPSMNIGTHSIDLDAAPCIIDDRTFVPVRAVAESLSAQVDWDSNARSVLITTAYPKNKDKTKEITSGEFYEKKVKEYEDEEGFGTARIEITDDAVVLSGRGKSITDVSLTLDGHYSGSESVRVNDVFYNKKESATRGDWLAKETWQDFEIRLPFSSFDKVKPFETKNYSQSVYMIVPRVNTLKESIGSKGDSFIFSESRITFRENPYIVKDGNGYSFARKDAALVWEHNKEFNSEWINPAKYISSVNNEELVNLSNEICADAESDYDKLLKIHDWVAENICYDTDFVNNKGDSAGNSAGAVYKSRRGVCEGYAALTKALVNAQGIPCRTVHGYSLGAGEPSSWSEELAKTKNTNHAWNRAYADNRWINIDNTWDSNSKYIDGKYYFSSKISYDYFDITDWDLSYDHKFIN